MIKLPISHNTLFFLAGMLLLWHHSHDWTAMGFAFIASIHLTFETGKTGASK